MLNKLKRVISSQPEAFTAKISKEGISMIIYSYIGFCVCIANDNNNTAWLIEMKDKKGKKADVVSREYKKFKEKVEEEGYEIVSNIEELGELPEVVKGLLKEETEGRVLV